MLTELTTFLLNPTTTTPFVELDYQVGKLDIIGKNAPKSSPEFYQQILSRVREHLGDQHQDLSINISLEEPDAHTNLEFIELLRTLKKETESQQTLFVNWYYDGYAEADCVLLEMQMRALGISYTLRPY